MAPSRDADDRLESVFISFSQELSFKETYEKTESFRLKWCEIYLEWKMYDENQIRLSMWKSENCLQSMLNNWSPGLIQLEPPFKLYIHIWKLRVRGLEHVIVSFYYLLNFFKVQHNQERGTSWKITCIAAVWHSLIKKSNEKNISVRNETDYRT